jgi:hypothetical protein
MKSANQAAMTMPWTTKKNSGAACKAAQLENQRRRKKVRAKPRKTAAAMNVAKLK